MRHPIPALAFALLLAAGCAPDAEETPRVDAAPTTAEAPDVRTASTSVSSDYWRVDADRLERERNDPAWRTAAEADRRARLEVRSGAPGSPMTARSPADRGPAGRSGPAPAQGGGSGGGESSGDEGDQTSGGDSSSAASAPIVRLRQAGSGSGASASSGSASGSGSSSASESWEDIGPDAFDGEPILPIPTDGGGPSVLRAQWLLDRAGFSPGVIDGRWGKNTEKAIYWLQDALGLETTGRLDAALYRRLASMVGGEGPVREVELTASDLEGPFTDIPEDVAEQAELDCLCHESAKEMVAERYHTTLDLLARLNPDVDLDALSAGTKIWVPAVEVVEKDGSVADDVERIVISKSGFYLHALDGDGNVLYHFPSTLGADYDPSPTGEFKVTAIAYDPDFHYQPKLFADVPDTEEDHYLPPGPNSPVGLVWMALSKDNYGIHGTSAPETIGYTSSHGCVRLTNWDAVFLANHVPAGVPVEFRE